MRRADITSAFLLILQKYFMKHLISASLLSADFSKLGEEIQMLNSSEVDWLHLDIMDGNFVPNFSYGFPVLKAISKNAKKILDVHLMIYHPEKYIERFKELNSGYLSVHYEAAPHLHRIIFQIKDCGIKAGVALNPHTPVMLLEDIIKDTDLVCIMGVNPGFGGQKFIENTYHKISELKNLILRKNADTLIEIDGGVDHLNAHRLLSEGADVLVAGSAIFGSNNPSASVIQLKQIQI